MIRGDHPPDALAALQRHFGHDSFRTGQQDLVETVLAGRDLLAVMPTGSGSGSILRCRFCGRREIIRARVGLPCSELAHAHALLSLVHSL